MRISTLRKRTFVQHWISFTKVLSKVLNTLRKRTFVQHWAIVRISPLNSAVNTEEAWKNALPPSKHSRLLILPYSWPFWTDYHQQQEQYLPSHLRSSSELLHRLAEDIKLSAHRRHPTVYPFTFVVLVFLVIFPFVLVSCITFGFSFQRQKVSSVQVWGCAMSHASPTSSLKLHSRSALSIKFHIGDNVQIKFGGMGTQSHTPCLDCIKKKFAYSCCPYISVDLKLCD
jgi:hypothetical protein